MNSKFVTFFLVIVTFVISGCGVSSYHAQVGYDIPPPGMIHGADQRETMMAPVGFLPKHVAFLDYAPRQCGDGPLSLEIKNESGNFVSLQIDGIDVQVMGAQAELPPYVPASGRGQNTHSLYLCLDSMGQHSITGTQYTPSGSQLVKMFDFHWDGEFTASKRHVARLVGTTPGILI